MWNFSEAIRPKTVASKSQLRALMNSTINGSRHEDSTPATTSVRVLEGCVVVAFIGYSYWLGLGACFGGGAKALAARASISLRAPAGSCHSCAVNCFARSMGMRTMPASLLRQSYWVKVTTPLD